MNFRVVFQTPGERDLDEAYRWIAAHEPLAAERWRERFYLALKSLESDPERMPLAEENKFVTRELREFHFGKLPYVFRVLFFVDGDLVRIARIVRAQRRLLTKAQMSEAIQTDPPTDQALL